MHEFYQQEQVLRSERCEDDKFSPVELHRKSDSLNDHRDQGRDNGVQNLEFPCVGHWRPRQDQTTEMYDPF